MTLRRYRVAPPPFWAVDGAPVWLQEREGVQLQAVIGGAPWYSRQEHCWLVRLRRVATLAGDAKKSAVDLRLLRPRVETEARP
jgi:hypothetical protein